MRENMLTMAWKEDIERMRMKEKEERKMDFMKTRDGAKGFVVALLIMAVMLLIDIFVDAAAREYVQANPESEGYSLVSLLAVELIVIGVLTTFLSFGMTDWGWWDKEN